MKKIIATFLLLSASVSVFSEQLNLKIMFYGIQSRGTGFTETMCQHYFHDFDFKKSPKNAKLSTHKKASNPSFYNNQIVATLKIKPHTYLEMIANQSDFTYKQKKYHLANTSAATVKDNPFIERGVISNAYCRAAYVELNNSVSLNPPAPKNQ